MPIHKNTQRKQLKGSTVMPERHVCTEICTLTEYCTQHRNELNCRTLAQMKQNLKQLGLRELRLHYIP